MPFKSALVTGATGFIGRALVRKLQENNTQVICLVREGSQATLPAGTQIVTVPSFQPGAIASALKTIQAEAVFHLAAYGVRPEQRNPLEMVQANVQATAELLTAVQNWPLKAFIYTGSCAEYGNLDTAAPIPETSLPSPTSIYGASKVAGGIYGAQTATQLKLPFVHLRLFGVYGKGEADYRLIPYLIDILRKQQAVDLTPGEQARDWLYVDDVVSALIAAANKPLQQGVYNICSGQPATVRQIALQVASALNCSAKLLDFGARPYREDEVMWQVGNNAAFHSATGWEPRISLSDGINRMVKEHD